MAGDVTYQALERLTYLPDRDATLNGLAIAGQKYYDVYITGGSISGVTFNPASLNIADNAFTVFDDLDPTKVMRFQASSILTGTTAVLTSPPASTTLVGTDSTQTLTNKSMDGGANTFTNIPGSAITGLGTMASQNANNVAITGGSVTGLNNTGFSIKDTDASNSLGIVPGSNLTADRTFTLVTGDANRTLTMTGDATISGTNTGDQTITLTGDVTGSGTGSFATTIANGVVTPAKLSTGHPTWATDGTTTITADTSSNTGLWITQTNFGPDYQFVVGLANTPTGSDSFAIDNAGSVLLGALSTPITIGSVKPRFQMLNSIGSSDPSGEMLLANTSTTDTTSARLIFSKRDGSAAVINNTTIGETAFYAWDGTAYIPAAYMRATTDSTVGTNDMPTRLTFAVTADGASTATEAMRITNNRGVVLDSATGASQGAGTVNAKGFYINGTVLPFTKEFISSNQTIPAAAGLLTVTHTLGVAPKIIQLWCVCTTTSNGFNAGDAFVMLDAWTNGSNSLNPEIYIDNANTTQINVRMGSGAAFSALVKNTGAAAAFTIGNFAFVVKAYA